MDCRFNSSILCKYFSRLLLLCLLQVKGIINKIYISYKVIDNNNNMK